jgi:hypothetical protein
VKGPANVDERGPKREQNKTGIPIKAQSSTILPLSGGSLAVLSLLLRATPQRPACIEWHWPGRGTGIAGRVLSRSSSALRQEARGCGAALRMPFETSSLAGSALESESVASHGSIVEASASISASISSRLHVLHLMIHPPPDALVVFDAADFPARLYPQ